VLCAIDRSNDDRWPGAVHVSLETAGVGQTPSGGSIADKGASLPYRFGEPDSETPTAGIV